MARYDWFRNTDWNPSIEAAFLERLRRARNKAQYIRIQAEYLEECHPDVAIDLIEKYFQLGRQFDQAPAYVVIAHASLALGRVDDALKALETALTHEQLHPSYKTRARFELPVLIARMKMKALCGRALELIAENQTQLVFAMDRYVSHGAHALILADLGQLSEAKAFAQAALAATRETRSPFANHPKVGLVVNKDDDFARRIAAIAVEQRGWIPRLFKSPR